MRSKYAQFTLQNFWKKLITHFSSKLKQASQGIKAAHSNIGSNRNI